MFRGKGEGFRKELKFELKRIFKDVYMQRLGMFRETVGWEKKYHSDSLG